MLGKSLNSMHYRSEVWKAIRMDWDVVGSRGWLLLWVNGRKVRFWLDMWCGDELLRDAFPSLLVIATSKEGWVVDVWGGTTEKGCWAPCFVRSPNDWELREVERFLGRLQRRGAQNWGKEGNFSVKQLYSDFPSKVLWKSYT